MRFNDKNIARVPFIVRKELYSITESKKDIRKRLGLDEDKFTVILAEGGYGLGKMEKICKIILERDLPVTLIPVCGTNRELFDKFSKIKSKGKTNFKPVGLIDNMYEYLAASDLFCGKSGANMIAETCFFALPHIITKYSTNIERHNGEYYIDTVGSALKIFKPEKVADKIEEFSLNPEKLTTFIEAAKAHRKEYGSKECAEKIFKLLCTRFPELEG